MSETTQPVGQREMTDEDFYALMASDVWLYNQDLSPYLKQWVAVLGEKIIDSDSDKEKLYHRLAALGGTIDRYKVLIRYIRGYDEPYR